MAAGLSFRRDFESGPQHTDKLDIWFGFAHKAVDGLKFNCGLSCTTWVDQGILIPLGEVTVEN